MAAWTERSDYESVNLNEDDATEVVDLLVSRGVGVKVGLLLPDGLTTPDNAALVGAAVSLLRS